MAENQSVVTVNCFTSKTALRHSEDTITCMKIKSSGRAIISELTGEPEQLQFSNIEKLYFDRGYFSDSVTRFIAGLQKLKVLEFDHTTVQNPKCIEQYIPTLEHLTVFNDLLLDNGCIFTVENVKRAIQLNPQLKGMRFRCDAFHPLPDRRNTPSVIRMLQLMSEKLQHLQYLGIHFSVDYYNDLKEPIVFNSVTQAMLYVQAYDFRWNPTEMNFPIAFVQLRELEIFSYDIYTDDCVDFAMKNDSLEKLKFHFHWKSESDDEESFLGYNILYEEDDEINKKANADQGFSNSNSQVDDDSYSDDDDEDSDEYDEDDDEQLQYDCHLSPFIKLTKQLPSLKELSIGPITKFSGEDIVTVLTTGKALEKLHIKLRYPLHHRRDARYAGVTKIEQQLLLVKGNDALKADWSGQVEFKFKPGSESEFRIANLIFQRNSQLDN